jgi:ABC-2 type transport system permease protein
MIYLFPLLFTGLMGAMMGQINPFFKATMAPAMLVFSLLCPTLLVLPGTIVGGRASGVYRSFKINAVSRWAILSVPVAALFLHCAISGALVIALSALCFHAALPAMSLAWVLRWCLAYLAFSGVGLLIGTLLDGDKAVLLISQIVFISSMMLGGLMVPLSILPSGLRSVAGALPASYAMGALSAAGLAPRESIVLSALTLVCAVLSLIFFRWDRANKAV